MLRKMMIVAAGTAFLVGCTTTDPYTGQTVNNNTGTGALAGGALGALAGLAVGGDAKGAAIGGALGAIAGGGVGAYMDSQEREFRRALAGTGVTVVRNGDRLTLIMPSNVTFPTDGYTILPNFYNALNGVAMVLKKYDRTAINVNGYTDSTGPADYNEQLSQRRANSVGNYLIQSGVGANRISAVGFGESNPIASNSTPEGRAQNRRVEVQISAVKM
ncbi:OmpA family protein [Martelella mediterranea]|uniref:Outer membrane protein OmpA-like peptidoglycan-associated protein n=1 Tax=Martelella mediterranea TaxID=293089 RepID=A0A4V2V4I9_9HYPH|nr:OmpA family protein [Martelella mediterranea]TCT39091.1 outer membrane protein OmpA-like peptidoglycan-associated protein [Martelella mediterranea]